MSIVEMRKQVNAAYNDADKWVAKTKKMSDNQIIAVWHRMKREGQIK